MKFSPALLFTMCLLAANAQLAAADVVAPASPDDAVFYEDFSRYQDGWPAKVYKGVFHISASEKFVRSKGGNLLGDMMGPMAVDWRDRKTAVFRFRMRFAGKVNPLTLSFKNWGYRVPESPFRRYLFKLTPDTVTLLLEGQRTPPKPNPKKPAQPVDQFHYPPLPPPVSFASVNLAPLTADKWYDVELQSLENRVRLFIRQNGRWICLIDAPVAAGGGLPSIDYPDGELDLGVMTVTDISGSK